MLGGQALAGATGLNADAAIVVVSAVCTLLAVFGYRLIHRADRWISLLTGLGFVYLTIRLLRTNDVAAAWHGGGFSPGTFLLVIAVAATWQIVYAPYVADYFRYLPKQTSISAAFWWTYAGSVLASAWMMCFGAVSAAVAAQAFEDGSVSFVVGQAAGAHGLFTAIIILGIIAINVLNLYGCFMSTATTLTAIRRHRIGPRGRIVYVVARWCRTWAAPTAPGSSASSSPRACTTWRCGRSSRRSTPRRRRRTRRRPLPGGPVKMPVTPRTAARRRTAPGAVTGVPTCAPQVGMKPATSPGAGFILATRTTRGATSPGWRCERWARSPGRGGRPRNRRGRTARSRRGCRR